MGQEGELGSTVQRRSRWRETDAEDSVDRSYLQFSSRYNPLHAYRSETELTPVFTVPEMWREIVTETELQG